MKILQIRFTDGPSLRAGALRDDEFTDIQYSSIASFLEHPMAILTYDFIAMFPKCSAFSMMAVGSHWKKMKDESYRPTSLHAKESLAMLKKMEQLAYLAKNCSKYWMIENPVGMFHKFWTLGDLHKITHCQYGSLRQKPTNVYCNFPWDHIPACSRGDLCHLATPRGTRHHGTQSYKTHAERTELPIKLAKELVKAVRSCYNT